MNFSNFVKILGGTFLMGSPKNEDERYNNELQHEVTVSDFSIGKFQVTNREFYEYLKATGKPLKQESDDLPVTNVSYIDATEYCEWITATRKNGVYRLPTEAEWEYACRAGSKTIYHFGDDASKLGDYAWFRNYSENTARTVHPVGKKLPNAWGLYDMHGNVWEWCSDWYESDYSTGKVINPKGPKTGSSRVLRGGGWDYSCRYCRCACRNSGVPGYRDEHVGFRVCFENR